MSITLHYLNKSRALRVVWLLEELGLKYNTKVYFRDPKTHLAPPELSKVHPSGNSPLIEDDGIVIAESGNILEHLVTKYGKDSSLIWKNEQEKNAIKYALYAAESNLFITGMMLGVHGTAVNMAPWGVSRLLKMIFQKIDSMYAKPGFDKCLKNLSDTIEANGGYYTNGRFTVADVMYWTSIEQFLNFGMLQNLDEEWPVLAKYYRRIEENTKYLQSKKKEKELDNSAPSKL